MIEIIIQRLGHQGDGIAAGPVFAPRTLPGETVTGHVEGTALTDIRIVTPSPDRVAPVCPHYKGCGGCAVQHGSDAFVAAWKTDIVRHALAAQGLETEILPIRTSPPQSRRRATFAARRTKKGALAGFHGRASDVIVEVPNCRLVEPAILQGLPVAEALAIAGGSRKGALAVTITTSDAGLDVSVTGGKPLDEALQVALAQFADARNLARLAWDGDVIAFRTPPAQMFGRAAVTPPPGAFLQATRQGEADLLDAVRRAVGGAGRIVDLFAGCGTFSLPLAEQAEIMAYEGDSAMIAALDEGWRFAPGLKAVQARARDLFRRPLTPDEFAGVDAVVIDPPRAGAEAQIAELARARVPVIAHVSCNPQSFARDARTLIEAGYRLDWVQPVDQFRWAAHVELAAAFSLAHMRA